MSRKRYSVERMVAAVRCATTIICRSSDGLLRYASNADLKPTYTQKKKSGAFRVGLSWESAFVAGTDSCLMMLGLKTVVFVAIVIIKSQWTIGKLIYGIQCETQ